MASDLHTEIIIDAPADRVWAALADFPAYPAWNPFITRISGALTPGQRLEVHLQPPGGRGMTIRPSVLEATPGRALRWLGHLGVPGLFDGEHQFLLEPAGQGRVRLVQSERFSGLLVPLLLRLIGAQTRQGFEAMNQALKTRVEQGA